MNIKKKIRHKTQNQKYPICETLISGTLINQISNLIFAKSSFAFLHSWFATNTILSSTPHLASKPYRVVHTLHLKQNRKSKENKFYFSLFTPLIFRPNLSLFSAIVFLSKNKHYLTSSNQNINLWKKLR